MGLCLKSEGPATGSRPEAGSLFCSSDMLFSATAKFIKCRLQTGKGSRRCLRHDGKDLGHTSGSVFAAASFQLFGQILQPDGAKASRHAFQIMCLLRQPLAIEIEPGVCQI